MPARRRWSVALVAIGVLAVLLFVAARLVFSMEPFGGRVEGARLLRAQASSQWRDGAFVNPQPPAPYTWGYAWTLITGQFLGDEVRVPPAALPVRRIEPAELREAAPAPALRAFWIGHASVYVEIDGVRLLVDPIFSEYASPFNAGPRRFHPPPIALDELPAIDAVLITHDHYDHLDLRSVRRLAERGSRFFVPLGIGAHLERWGVAAAQIVEFEWWQEQRLRGVRVVSTPARHYSGRRLGEPNPTLWTSWSVLGERHRFHVTGDTGYGDHFKAIGERLGPFDLAFVKAGAYGPGNPWLDIHMSAEDAVRAHAELRGRRMVPVHWGTFNLAFHDWSEPIRRTLAAAKSAGVEVLTPRFGEIVEADRPFASTAWWEAVR